jgi:hypothetical protein
MSQRDPERAREARDREAAVQRLRLALSLFDDGVELMRQNLRRRHPGASEAEIFEALGAWLRTRPGAEHGDCPGRAIRYRG